MTKKSERDRLMERVEKHYIDEINKELDEIEMKQKKYDALQEKYKTLLQKEEELIKENERLDRILEKARSKFLNSIKSCNKLKSL